MPSLSWFGLRGFLENCSPFLKLITSLVKYSFGDLESLQLLLVLVLLADAGLHLLGLQRLVGVNPPLNPVLPLIVVGESVLRQVRVQLCSILKLP